MLEQLQNEAEMEAALRFEKSKRNGQVRIEANQQCKAEIRKAEELTHTVQEHQNAIAKKKYKHFETNRK
jgi:hypothetical protein